MVVRANKGADSDTITNVYFFENDFTNLPIINLTIEPSDLFKFDKGILVYGKEKPNWDKKRQVTGDIAIFSESGHVEHEGQVDIKVHGNASRKYTVKSLRLYPRKKYNKDGIEHDLFGDNHSLDLQRVNLRNSGQDYSRTFLADASMHQAFAELNFGVQRYRPYLVFLNGQYYGILNARDRRDHHYLKARYQLPNKKVDHIKRSVDVKRGDDKTWKKLLTTIDSKDSDSEKFYTDIAEQMDLASFVDYFAAEVFVANTDWPQNNIAYWRYAGSNKHPITKDGYTDGRWRWLLYDLDLYGDRQNGKHTGAKHNSIKRLLEYGPDEANEESIFRHLLQNPQIQEDFLVRFSDLLNSHFLPERFEAIIRRNEAGIEDEMPRHIRRWLHPQNMRHWRKYINEFIEFFEHRPKYQRRHLSDAFDLGKHYPVEVDVSHKDAGRIELNTLTLAGNQPDNPEPEYVPLHLPWQGVYFEVLPLTVEAVANDGFEFSHWQADGVSLDDPNNPKQVVYPQQALKLKAVFDR